MFSKRTMMIVGLLVVIAVNIIILSVSSRTREPEYGLGRLAIYFVSPFQKAVTHTVRFVEGIWEHYFFLVSVARENDQLRRQLDEALERGHRYTEVELTNQRLYSLLNFQKSISREVLPAAVIGKDPSTWFKTVIIDKGIRDGVEKGLPVVVPAGIVGQVMEVAGNYAKVLLVIDQNNAVDALVQRSRARGLVTGAAAGRCVIKYVLLKNDVRIGDILISSGLDGVFPKGLRVGLVSDVIRSDAGIFQEVRVTPYVDFEKLEEVLVVLNPPERIIFSK
ncbi:MAG: rod shape-determining protein MreC [Desulfobacterales bacterium]|nr:rod shape-determining protein MreC [Desulfobacterales bacterium]